MGLCHWLMFNQMLDHFLFLLLVVFLLVVFLLMIFHITHRLIYFVFLVVIFLLLCRLYHILMVL
ncbi:hypothetical protein D7V91_17435 [bacterium 1xD42-67]|nr:hypothetical protein D7V91_17435 [bacterium 1xD42-67]